MSKIKIIAEAGVNHNGSLATALKMVDAAKTAGADYIKFQTFRTENLVSSDCRAADYQTKNSGAVSQHEMLKKLELSYDDFRKIKEYCDKKGIGFLSTPFDSESLEFIASLNPDYIKVPSGEVTNLPFLREIADTGIPVIISTGMCTTIDVKNALIPFESQSYNAENIILLHCTTEYPAPLKDVNLLAMQSMRKDFELPVGYSDHTIGITIPLAAAALGAVMIEKHFTLSRDMEGPDHKASLEPDELSEMMKRIREIELALGKPQKFIAPSESKNLSAARKSIVAAREIKKGDIFKAEDLKTLRPGDGLSPMLWDEIIGSKAIKDFSVNQKIEL